MAVQTFTWGEFADPSDPTRRAFLFVDYEDTTNEVQRLRVTNNTGRGAYVRITDTTDSSFVEATVPAGQNASRNLPNNKYHLQSDGEGGLGTGAWGLEFRGL